MAVMVPGGQATFVQTNGALAYTQAHSASMFNLSSQDTRAYVGGGYFGPGGVGLTACPAQGGEEGVWQVFAKLAGVTFGSDCVGFYGQVSAVDEHVVGAWQYT